MHKPLLYALRILLALQLASAVVFTPTQKVIRLIPFLILVWIAVETVNGIKNGAATQLTRNGTQHKKERA